MHIFYYVKEFVWKCTAHEYISLSLSSPLLQPPTPSSSFADRNNFSYFFFLVAFSFCNLASARIAQCCYFDDLCMYKYIYILFVWSLSNVYVWMWFLFFHHFYGWWVRSSSYNIGFVVVQSPHTVWYLYTMSQCKIRLCVEAFTINTQTMGWYHGIFNWFVCLFVLSFVDVVSHLMVMLMVLFYFMLFFFCSLFLNFFYVFPSLSHFSISISFQ